MSRQPSAKQRVLNGCALLDREEPGWAQRVNGATLTITLGSDCVLGQLFGHFIRAPKKLGVLTYKDEYRLGFTGEFGDHYHRDAATLERHWRREIARRQREAGS